MSIETGSVASIQSYPQICANVLRRPSEACVGKNTDLLQAVLSKSRARAVQFAGHDPQRVTSLHFAVLAEELIGRGAASPLAKSTARALLCTHCRDRNAAQSQCAGRPLDCCLLRNGASQ